MAFSIPLKTKADSRESTGRWDIASCMHVGSANNIDIDAILDRYGFKN